MRRIIWLSVIVALCISVALIGYAAETKLTKDNIGKLKGTWTGTRTFIILGKNDVNSASLEITSDGLPVKAVLKVAKVPDVTEGASNSKPGTQDATIEGEGIISSKGTLLFTGAKAMNFLELTLDGGGKKLSGAFYYNGVHGMMALTKKE